MTMETSSYLQAKAHALPLYIGDPCQVGHEGERYTSTRQCRACAIAYRQARKAQDATRAKAKRASKKTELDALFS